MPVFFYRHTGQSEQFFQKKLFTLKSYQITQSQS